MMKRVAKLFLLFIVTIYVVVCVVVAVSQRSLIYHPRPYGRAYVHVLPPNGVEIEYTLPFGKQTAFYVAPPPIEPPPRPDPMPGRPTPTPI